MFFRHKIEISKRMKQIFLSMIVVKLKFFEKLLSNTISQLLINRLIHPTYQCSRILSILHKNVDLKLKTTGIYLQERIDLFIGI